MIRWIDRTFGFDFPAELFPNLLERLNGTPARAEEKVQGLSPSVLTRRRNDTWSIQEHIGHLIEIDQLHLGRVEDLNNGLRSFRPADMSNRSTNEADYNAWSITDLLDRFRMTRGALAEGLATLCRTSPEKRAFHERLGRELRPVDLVCFVAEHDDHHLAMITELLRTSVSAASTS